MTCEYFYIFLHFSPLNIGCLWTENLKGFSLNTFPLALNMVSTIPGKYFKSFPKIRISGLWYSTGEMQEIYLS